MPHEFREKEIKDFGGITKSNRNPQPNECADVVNLDNTGYIDGDYSTRSAYEKLYDAPADSRLSGITQKAITTLYETTAGDNQEIILAVGKATLHPETVGDSATIDIFTVFASHRWSGSEWEHKDSFGNTGWNWLNHCILTKIVDIGGSPYILKLNTQDSSLFSDKLCRWTIYNVTKGETAQIIESFNYSSTGYLGLDISNNTHGWEVDDVVILMKNYIPYNYLTGNASAVADDISFYRVYDDVRISFGGYENRLAVSVGYRKTYLLLKAIEFGSFSSSELANFATINDLILDPYITEGTDAEVKLTENISSTSLSGTFTFKLFAVLDNYERLYLGERSLALTQNRAIAVDFNVVAGTENKRITALRTYWSNDGLNFFLYKEFPFRQSTDASGAYMLLSNSGNYQIYVGIELNNVNDCVKPGTDANNVDNWTKTSAARLTSESGGSGSSYYLEATRKDDVLAFESFYPNKLSFNTNAIYVVEFDAKVANKLNTPTITFWDTDFEFTNDNTWEHKTTGTSGLQAINPYISFGAEISSTNFVAIDNLSIKLKTVLFTTIPADALRMEDDLGYSVISGVNYAKSFDKAVVASGKTFAANPFFDVRQSNKIFFSPFSGQGASQYDVLSIVNYMDLEIFDGNELVNIEVLPNMDLLAQKRNTTQRVDTITGAARDIAMGRGILSRRSSVNFGDKIIWGDKNNLYVSDGLSVQDISISLIREEYRLLPDKSAIFAVRDETGGNYRFFSGDAYNNEYLFSSRGWTKQRRTNIPEAYARTYDGTILFLSSGAVYRDGTDLPTTELDDAATFLWKSIPFDVALIGEDIKNASMIYVNQVWMRYKVNVEAVNPMTISIAAYFDDELYETKTFTVQAAGEGLFQERLRLISNNKARMGKKVQFEISGTSKQGSIFSLLSFGFSWKNVDTLVRS